jgi:hypothetical protein
MFFRKMAVVLGHPANEMYPPDPLHKVKGGSAIWIGGSGKQPFFHPALLQHVRPPLSLLVIVHYCAEISMERARTASNPWYNAAFENRVQKNPLFVHNFRDRVSGGAIRGRCGAGLGGGEEVL